MANKKVLEIVVKDKATPAVKKIDKSLKNTGKQAKKTGEEMNSAIGNVSPRIGGLINQVKSIGTSFKALAVGGAVGAIAGLGSLFVMATKKGAEFAKQMSTLKAVSGATSSEMDAMSNSAKELGSSTQFTANQVGELQTEFAKMGFTTKQILASTKATLDLAASLEVGLANAAMLAGSTVNAFGLEAKDTQRVVDVLAKSTSSSALDFSSLTEAFKNVAPAAAATNRSVEETTGLLGILANNGIKGSRAGTGLSKAFIELNKQGIPLNDALDKIKNSSNSLKTAMQIAGEVGGKALSVLANKRPQIDSLTRTLENSAGAAKEMAEVRLDNLAGDTTKLSSAWEGFLLSIEDGEGLFSSIARGIVQATTALLNFITPTTKLSESLEKERFALFKTEAELDRLDVKMQDTTLSEEDLEKAQQDRVTVIDELKLKYPKYLEDIDAETTSTEDLKKAIDQVNESLINKIIIQEKEEEILEQAEDTAARRLKLDEKQQATQNYALKLKQELSDLNIKIKATSPNEILKELNEIELEQNRLRLEGNGQNKLKIGQIAELIDKQNNLKSRIKAVNDAEENYNNEQSITNKLTEEKDALMKRLNITTEELTDNTGGNAGSTGELTDETRDLIKEQEDLLELYNKMPQATRAELAEKNILIAGVNAQIKMLKSLGIEQKKVVKQKKALIDEEIIAEEKRQKRIIEINESLNKKIETDAAKTSIEKIQLAKKRALEELNQLNATEKQKAATILFWDGKIEEAKEKTQQDELIKEEQQFQMLQKLQNTAQEQELLELAQQYDAKILLAEGNAELMLALNEQQKIDEAAIDDKYNAERLALSNAASQKILDKDIADTQARIDNQNAILNATSSALSSIGQIADAFAGDDEERAKKAFNINKGLGIAQAIIATSQGIMNAYVNPIDVASGVAFAKSIGIGLAGAAQIATIATTKFQPAGGGVTTTPTTTTPPSGGANTSPTNAPNFNVVGQSGFNQVASALGTQQPVQAFVVAGNVTTAQQLANNTIQTATL